MKSKLLVSVILKVLCQKCLPKYSAFRTFETLNFCTFVQRLELQTLSLFLALQANHSNRITFLGISLFCQHERTRVQKFMSRIPETFRAQKFLYSVLLCATKWTLVSKTEKVLFLVQFLSKLYLITSMLFCYLKNLFINKMQISLLFDYFCSILKYF